MKKTLALILAATFTLFCLSGCGKQSLLNPRDPVVLTMWHTYGEQTDSPMNRLRLWTNSWMNSIPPSAESAASS